MSTNWKENTSHGLIIGFPIIFPSGVYEMSANISLPIKVLMKIGSCSGILILEHYVY